MDCQFGKDDNNGGVSRNFKTPMQEITRTSHLNTFYEYVSANSTIKSDENRDCFQANTFKKINSNVRSDHVRKSTHALIIFKFCFM